MLYSKSSTRTISEKLSAFHRMFDSYFYCSTFFVAYFVLFHSDGLVAAILCTESDKTNVCYPYQKTVNNILIRNQLL